MKDGIYCAVVTSSFGLSMGAVWQHMTMEMGGVGISERKDAFFELMGRLLREGKVRLATDGVFLQGDWREQLTLISNAWPENPGEDDIDGFGLWFLTDAPAGLVWIGADGREQWT
ncbi:TPA: DUF596 domain-containing protein [Stenotrophomonas maltophilia]|jgi:hypothetical protein|uniref:DUF596 domain-containing protein n=1 Tax=Stenotrophomonas maltophilia TaxID=40324 RepID=A0AAI9CI88_STEMA|nr:DUF596 domain-containing protein [Stenotrophomonas maltophilia]CRQ92685.1 hypothetical protein PAERUG_E15_London_28_01_14_06955 [Pseudomonas aeruginosa]EJP77803.1 hypothetical protein A1OC_01244 [Stenotrophomonas maltophilia Ab55555]EKT2104413.1 DUF596 domain-containing protein [Stenotrophomonas maltophilia]EKZ1925757.1 DUF596 domain-containing protein [Stenotrophomonas maltophilia]ELE7121921.1 DUF596 domain-containing protein [Stenotrophomonas maltophilia]